MIATNNKKWDSIRFWPNKFNDKMFRSHGTGLTEEQVAILHDLKKGDKMVMFLNNDGTISLKKDKPLIRDINDHPAKVFSTVSQRSNLDPERHTDYNKEPF